MLPLMMTVLVGSRTNSTLMASTNHQGDAMNINYLAKQMGHKNINMIAAIYGKWLDEANKNESARVQEDLKKVGSLKATR